SGERLRVEGEALVVLDPLAPEAAEALLRQRAPDLAGETRAALARRLGGHPLALVEHAAAGRSDRPVLDPAGERSRLRSALDQVWARLPSWEQEALAQCSALPDGFSLEQAEAAIRLEDPDAPWALDVLQALTDKSLIRA